MLKTVMAIGFWIAPPVAVVMAMALAVLAWRSRQVHYPMLEDHTTMLARGLFESPMIRAFETLGADVDVQTDLAFIRDVDVPGQDRLRLTARWDRANGQEVTLEVETQRRTPNKARVELRVAPLGEHLSDILLHFGGAGPCTDIQSQRLANALRNMMLPPSTAALYLSRVQGRERLYQELNGHALSGWQIDMRHDQFRFTYPSFTSMHANPRFEATLETLDAWYDDARKPKDALEDALEDAFLIDPSAPIALMMFAHLLELREDPTTLIARAHEHRLDEVRWEALLQAPMSLPAEDALARFRDAVDKVSATEGLRHVRALIEHFEGHEEAASILCEHAIEHVLPTLRHEVAAALTAWFPDALDAVITSRQARQTLSNWVLESSYDPHTLRAWLPLLEGPIVGRSMLLRIWSTHDISNAELEALTQQTLQWWTEDDKRLLFTELLAMWEDYKPSRRTLLRTFADPEALESFYLEQLNHADAHQRLIALRGLRGVGGGRTLEVLRTWSKGLFVSPEHKREAAQTLAAIEQRAHVGGLSVSGAPLPSGALEMTQSTGDLEMFEEES